MSTDSDTQWNDEYEMLSEDGGQHWRGFARHHPSGEVFILEQDRAPGYAGNYTALLGPLHHTEITREGLEQANMADADPEDLVWALGQTWVSVTLDS